MPRPVEILDALSTNSSSLIVCRQRGRQLTGQYSGTLSEVLGRFRAMDNISLRCRPERLKVFVLPGQFSNGRFLGSKPPKKLCRPLLSAESPPAAPVPGLPTVLQFSIGHFSAPWTLDSRNTNLPHNFEQHAF